MRASAPTTKKYSNYDSIRRSSHANHRHAGTEIRSLSYFADLCAIPHGSGNTKAISDYCVRFAESHGFEVHQDALNNVIIVCPATPGCESAEPVIIQGHLDMVTEKRRTARWT